MSVTNIHSAWVDGNLVFGAEYGGQATDGTFVRFRTGVKMHRRPTAEAFGVEAKTEFTDTDSAHRAIDVTADWKAAGVAGGGNIALSGVARLAATYTATGGSVQGLYGQFCNLGTLNGSGIMANAIYGLIEDGGTYTAVSHLACAWLDSHLTKTVTAGSTEFLYLSNNGTTTFDQAFYVYAGNKITALFNINTASGMATNAGVPSTAAGSIKVVVEGVTKYIPLYTSPTGG